MKLNRTGVILSSTNIVLILIVAIFEYLISGNSNQAGGWTLLLPVLWNLPSAALLFPLAAINLPEWFLLGALIVLGAVQWYLIGYGVEALIRRLFHKNKV